MSSQIPIARPDLGDLEAEAAARVVRSGWVMQGPEVAAFEQELAAAVGAEHAVAVSSGTAALQLALRALGVGPGDEVVTVSHSFIATANAVTHAGARPVFVDVEASRFGLDPGELPRAIGDRTKAILCVHQMGIPCDVERILAAAAPRGLPVVEDAACAIGSELEVQSGGAAARWERVGKPHGALACFSFHPRKVVTTGEGGMVTTADAALAARVRLLRQHALRADGRFAEPAFNHRMTDLQAAIGRPQLRRLQASLAERRRLAARFAAALGDHPVLAPPPLPVSVRSNWQSYPAIVRDGARATQIEVLRRLGSRGIAAQPGITNAHQEPAYAGHPHRPLPVSERLHDTTVLLPLFHGMTASEVETVVEALAELARR